MLSRRIVTTANIATCSAYSKVYPFHSLLYTFFTDIRTGLRRWTFDQMLAFLFIHSAFLSLYDKPESMDITDR
jgi:hypothetical protein